ncbi:hypothetical protein IV102_34760 [bacterium]|nr:hypothetical protein [bacterium]
MYRLLSERARFRILSRVCAGGDLLLTGCWLRGPGKWTWRSEGAATPPAGGYFYHWNSLGVRLISPSEAQLDTLARVRVSYRKALLRQACKSLLRRWAKSLRCQRTSLAEQLHRGLCQVAMVVDLQSHWLKNCPPPERDQAQEELLQSISTLTTEFSQFFQEQLAAGGESGCQGFAANTVAGHFCRELVLTSRALDRNVEIEASLHRMTFRFGCAKERRAALTHLLHGLKLAGIAVKAGPDEVVLSLF